jgi:hypothetical protein
VTQAPRARVLWTECGLVTPAVSEAAKRVVRLSCVRSVVDDESDVQAQLERLAARSARRSPRQSGRFTADARPAALA